MNNTIHPNVDPSERTKSWIKDNPEKYQALQRRERKKKIERQNESIAAWKVARYKTPISAIRAYCNRCEYGESRGVFDKAPVKCNQTDCPLYCFRNGNPQSIAVGLRKKNIRSNQPRRGGRK